MSSRLKRASPLLLGLLLSGCAANNAINGRVVDRNGRPLDRVIVSLEPGNVELLTDSSGTFRIDYLRDGGGRRVRLQRRTSYEVELLKPGYHVGHSRFDYSRGELVLDAMTLTEDSLDLAPGETSLDPALYPDRSTSEGSTYEGE